MSSLICAALMAEQHSQTLAVVTYQQQDMSGQYAFYLKTANRDLTVNISDHPCLVTLNGLSRQLLDNNEWAANITFAADGTILMADVLTGITCTLTIR